MEIILKFTPEEFKEHQDLIEKGETYDKVAEQRDEADYKFKALQDAIHEAGFGITISMSGGRADIYTLNKMDKETKEFWDKYPGPYIKSYQE